VNTFHVQETQVKYYWLIMLASETILKLSGCYSFPACYHSVLKMTNSVSNKT